MVTTVAVKPTQKEIKSSYADPAFESKLASNSPKCAVERRFHRRFPFTAAVTAVEVRALAISVSVRCAPPSPITGPPRSIGPR